MALAHFFPRRKGTRPVLQRKFRRLPLRLSLVLPGTITILYPPYLHASLMAFVGLPHTLAGNMISCLVTFKSGQSQAPQVFKELGHFFPRHWCQLRPNFQTWRDAQVAIKLHNMYFLQSSQHDIPPNCCSPCFWFFFFTPPQKKKYI